MSLPYIPGHIIDEAKDRRRQGDSIATLASRLGVSPEALATLLGEPSAKPVTQQSDDFDLWAVDRAKGCFDGQEAGQSHPRRKRDAQPGMASHSSHHAQEPIEGKTSGLTR